MRLLVITQKVSKNDANLGFFHAWLKRLADRVERLYVICLEAGEHELPADKVTVLSLGKESKQSRLRYLILFYKYIWRYRHDYDHVLVHMNPEYVVLGGLFWRLYAKKILMWYTHKAVNLKLRLATFLSTKIFTASKESFRLPSLKVEVTGHGIDVDSLRGAEVNWPIERLRLVTAGRITPSKDLSTLIRSVACLKSHLTEPVTLTVIGEAVTSADKHYKQELEELARSLGVEDNVSFIGARHYDEMRDQYATHQIFIHASQTGSMDKAVLEALAAGLFVYSSSEAYKNFARETAVESFTAGCEKELAEMIEKRWLSGIVCKNQIGKDWVVAHHNLKNLIIKILAYFSKE